MANAAQGPWVIELYTPGMPAPVRYNFETNLVIGRSSSKDNFVPDVDLAAFDAANQGVSRQHLQVFAERDQLYLVDLESPNGSYLNGERLEPNHGYVLVNGDEVHLGNLPLQVHVVMTPFSGSGELDPEKAMAAAFRGKGELVLIVESDTNTANGYQQSLLEAGYRTRIAPEVLRAIRM